MNQPREIETFIKEYGWKWDFINSTPTVKRKTHFKYGCIELLRPTVRLYRE